MDTLIEPIRTALLPDASLEARRQGALACRTILAVLEPSSGALGELVVLALYSITSASVVTPAPVQFSGPVST